MILENFLKLCSYKYYSIIYDDAVIGSNRCYPKPSYLSKYIASIEITNQSLADKHPYYIIYLGDHA